MSQDRDDKGRYTSNPDTEPPVLDVMNVGEAYRSGEIADELGITRRHATRLLSELEDAGRVEKTMVHERLAIWTKLEADDDE